MKKSLVMVLAVVVTSAILPALGSATNSVPSVNLFGAIKIDGNTS